MSLWKNINVEGADEQARVDAYLMKRIDRLFDVGFQEDMTPQRRAELINDYRLCLRNNPIWVLKDAIEIALRSCNGRPTPGNIQSAVNSVTKSHKDQIGRLRREEEREADLKRLEPKPRTDEQRSRAQHIVQQAGYTAKRAATLKAKPLITTRQELDDLQNAPPVEHWSKGCAADDPRMIALRKARANNPLMNPTTDIAAE